MSLPLIRNTRKFISGMIGMLIFIAALVVGCYPLADNMTALQWADNYFNSLSKASAFHVDDLENKASPAVDHDQFQAEVKLKSHDEATRFAEMMGKAGLTVRQLGLSVRIEGSLGQTGRWAIADARLLHEQRGTEFQQKYGISGREAVYWWWLSFNDIYQYFIEKGDFAASNFASSMRTKVCEPAYNFADIKPASAADSWGRLSMLLGFYVVYTVWYGFSIMLLFEGLGIEPRKTKKGEA